MYSQGIEEKIITDYFGGRVGALIDFGANDGVTLSNSRKLMELGWTGVFVEASHIAYERLVKSYEGIKDAHIFNVLISENDGVYDFYESGHVRLKRAPDNFSLVSTVHKDLMKGWKTMFEKIEKEGVCFSTFLKECPIKKFNFITIDIEGEDYNLLKQMNLDELGCELLCVEYMNENDIQNFSSYCKGFNEVGRTKTNLLLAR